MSALDGFRYFARFGVCKGRLSPGGAAGAKGRRLVFVVVWNGALAWAGPTATGGGTAAGKPRPWWDRFPRIVSISEPGAARAMHADADLCGAADDPTWGLYGQRLRLRAYGRRIRELHAAGVKAMTWFEAFGTAGNCYVAQLKRNATGGWLKYPEDPTLTRVFAQHWNWQRFDGTGVIRWIGVHNYFDNDDFARPYTRFHPRYGCPPMTYPDGRAATGYDGPAGDPRNCRVYDAGCAKDVFGRVHFGYGFNAAVNALDPKTGKPRGPITGLLKVRGQFAGLVSPGKDAACPVWIDYARASVRQALDAGIDGLWCDNYSAWDSFGARPVMKAFGDWSVATFRGYLGRHFTREQLARFGITNLERFDIRTYLLARRRQWGGRPLDTFAAELRDPFDRRHAVFRDRVWRDRRWLDDPVWRAYLIHRRQSGERALTAYYRALKREALAAGKPDFLVAGNDIPIMSYGWVRGNLDMVSAELSWGWGLASGSRGFMPPPLGSYVPLYKLARAHARSRFVNVWMYVPRAQWHKPGITAVLYYQALANHTLPMPHPNNPRTVGSRKDAAAFFDFVGRAAAVFGDREPMERVGLYYSSSSQLMTVTPGGTVDFNHQLHMFAHWGWGTALTWLHIPYCAVPEWELTAARLARLKALIIPCAEVFPPEAVPVLRAWLRAGGRLLVTGKTGLRGGENRNFDRLERPALAPIFGGKLRRPPARRLDRTLGGGRAVWIPEPVGFEFYQADKSRPRLLDGLRKILDSVLPEEARPVHAVEGEKIPFTLGLTVYADPRARRLFVDINNTDIDLSSDAIAPAPAVAFRVVRPSWLGRGGVRLRALSPGGPTAAALVRSTAESLTLRVGPVRVYASVVIAPEAAESAGPAAGP